MNSITRNILHDWWFLERARTIADVQRLAEQKLGLKLTAEKTEKILNDKIPPEQWYQTKIIAAIKEEYPSAFVRKISAGVYAERGFPDVLAIINGQYYGIEVKRPFFGKPSQLQLVTIEAIKKAGGTAGIAHLPIEAMEIISFGNVVNDS